MLHKVLTAAGWERRPLAKMAKGAGGESRKCRKKRKAAETSENVKATTAERK